MTKKEDEVLIGTLVKEGLLRKNDLARFDGVSEEMLASKGITRTLTSLLRIDEQKIAQIIANTFNVPLMPSIDGQKWIDVPNLPEENLPKYRIIPVFIERKELTVVFIDPPYKAVIELVEKVTGKRVVPVVVTTSDFEELKRRKKDEVVAAKTSTLVLEKLDAGNGDGSGPTSKISSNLKSPIDVLNKVVEAAIDADASDIHFEHTRKGLLRVRYRVDSVLQNAVTLTHNYATSIPPILKQAGSLDSINKRKAQEGQAKFSIRGHKILARINTIPTSQGETITLRISNKILKFISLDEIGMSNHDLSRLRQLLMQTDAIILFVGPSGCGKTTTMYAVLSELKDDTKNIATIENPIERLIDGINQTSAGSDRDISFIEGVRSLFHHDVDVMGVGEIRDKETAELIIEAGFTGILALSTVQASDAIKSLFRLQNLGVNPEDLSLAVRGIVAQRFVRIACPHCAENVRPNRDTLELAGLLNLPERISLKRAKGCKACLKSGYINRWPIFETLLINEELSNLIHKGSSYVEIKKAAEDSGFTTMRYDGLRKALAGVTTLEEVLRVT